MSAAIPVQSKSANEAIELYTHLLSSAAPGEESEMPMGYRGSPPTRWRSSTLLGELPNNRDALQ
jgi:hypothetical protein